VTKNNAVQPQIQYSDTFVTIWKQSRHTIISIDTQNMSWSVSNKQINWPLQKFRRGKSSALQWLWNISGDNEDRLSSIFFMQSIDLVLYYIPTQKSAPKMPHRHGPIAKSYHKKGHFYLMQRSWYTTQQPLSALGQPARNSGRRASPTLKAENSAELLARDGRSYFLMLVQSSLICSIE